METARNPHKKVRKKQENAHSTPSTFRKFLNYNHLINTEATMPTAKTQTSQSSPFKRLLDYLPFVTAFLILIVLIVPLPLHSKKTTSLASATPSPTLTPTFLLPTKSGRPPQFVILSFDGSQSLEMWQATRDFAQEMNKNGKPLHFTYFISGVYFLAPEAASTYLPPGLPPGTSGIGFSETKDDIAKRVEQINSAFAEGHEIGSHANGHFDGTYWSYDQWKQEFSQFNQLVFNWKTNNQIGNIDKSNDLHVRPEDIKSFRAPLLGKNEEMYHALYDQGFRYDSSSLAATPGAWPTKDKSGVWSIPMAAISVSGTRAVTLTMDYNFFITQSRGREVARRGSPLWEKFHQQMYQSYVDHFNNNYNGTRAPVVIGHHFSTWNDGVYWQSMKDFAQQVCGQPEVYCVTFSELGSYLNLNFRE
jgi:hypothetical protein